MPVGQRVLRLGGEGEAERVRREARVLRLAVLGRSRGGDAESHAGDRARGHERYNGEVALGRLLLSVSGRRGLHEPQQLTEPGREVLRGHPGAALGWSGDPYPDRHYRTFASRHRSGRTGQGDFRHR